MKFLNILSILLLLIACDKNGTVVEDDNALNENVFVLSNELIDYESDDDVPIQNSQFPANFLRRFVIDTRVVNPVAFPDFKPFSIRIGMAFQKNNGTFADLGDVEINGINLFPRDTIINNINSHRIFDYRGTNVLTDTLGLWLLFNQNPTLSIKNSPDFEDIDRHVAIPPTIVISDIRESFNGDDSKIEVVFNRDLTPESTLISITTHVNRNRLRPGETGYYNFIPISARNRIVIPKQIIQRLVEISDIRRRIRIWVAERTFLGYLELTPRNTNSDIKSLMPVGRISTHLTELTF